MKRLATLQIVGPGVISAAISAADAAAYALDQSPSSVSLWYINLELFGIFQKSHNVLNSLTGTSHSELFFIATPLLLLAISGAAFGLSLITALASNLSCLYATFLVYVWYANEQPLREASLAAPILSTNFSISAETIVCGLMLVMTSLSFCTSHAIYIRLLRRDMNIR